MTPLELYEKAGKPHRAIIRLSEPTKVYSGIRRSSVVAEFEAFITTTTSGILAYYWNPSARHAFYMPDNVTEFIPVDTMELWRRARKAAAYIKAEKTRGRELDNAFEHYDGDEMAAALWRMALKSDRLMTAIKKEWANGTQTFEKEYATFSHLTDQELSDHAKITREKRL